MHEEPHIGTNQNIYVYQKAMSELTEKQVYARWAKLNQERWRLDEN